MKLLIKNILVGIAVIPLFFHIIILCVNVLRGNVEIRDDISHYKSRKSIKYKIIRLVNSYLNREIDKKRI